MSKFLVDIAKQGTKTGTHWVCVLGGINLVWGEIPVHQWSECKLGLAQSAEGLNARLKKEVQHTCLPRPARTCVFHSTVLLWWVPEFLTAHFCYCQGCDWSTLGLFTQWQRLRLTLCSFGPRSSAFHGALSPPRNAGVSPRAFALTRRRNTSSSWEYFS